jgi:hypothetical protein
LVQTTPPSSLPGLLRAAFHHATFAKRWRFNGCSDKLLALSPAKKVQSLCRWRDMRSREWQMIPHTGQCVPLWPNFMLKLFVRSARIYCLNWLYWHANGFRVLFELIWRDYFRFLSAKYGNSIFHLGNDTVVSHVLRYHTLKKVSFGILPFSFITKRVHYCFILKRKGRI